MLDLGPQAQVELREYGGRGEGEQSTNLPLLLAPAASSGNCPNHPQP